MRPVILEGGTICPYDASLGGWRCRSCRRGLIMPEPGHDTPGPGTRCPGCQAAVVRACRHWWDALSWTRIVVVGLPLLLLVALMTLAPPPPWTLLLLLLLISAAAIVLSEQW